MLDEISKKINKFKKSQSLRNTQELEFSHIASTEFVILRIQKYGALPQSPEKGSEKI